jgi:hypothetical protein
MGDKIDIKYITQKVLVDKASFGRFYFLKDERRMIRPNHVRRIMKGLKQGTHFETNLTVNEKDGKWRVIDGNHRLEAIREMIKSNPDFNIIVWVDVYRDMTREQERQVYHIRNLGEKETGTDFLQIYFKTIPTGKEMLKKLPASVNGSENKMKLKDLVGNHIESKRGITFTGGYNGSRRKMIEEFKELNSGDVDVILAWYKDMKEIFGDYVKRSPYYRSTPLQVFYRIWYDNRHIPRDKFVEAFRKIILNKWGELNELSGHGGRSAAKTFYRVVLERLNDYRKNIHFIEDHEVIESRAKAQEKRIPIKKTVKKKRELKRWHPKTVKTMIRLWKNGKSIKEISKELGETYMRVNNKIQYMIKEKKNKKGEQ